MFLFFLDQQLQHVCFFFCFCFHWAKDEKPITEDSGYHPWPPPNSLHCLLAFSLTTFTTSFFSPRLLQYTQVIVARVTMRIALCILSDSWVSIFIFLYVVSSNCLWILLRLPHPSRKKTRRSPTHTRANPWWKRRGSTGQMICCMFTITSCASISGVKLEIKILTEAAPLSSWAIKAPKHASSGAGLLSETTPPFPNLGPATFEEAEAISSSSLSVIGVRPITLPRLSYVFTSWFPFSSASQLLPEKSFFHKGCCR